MFFLSHYFPIIDMFTASQLRLQLVYSHVIGIGIELFIFMFQISSAL